VTAGVFIATNVTTFATALRGVLTVLRPMVILQRTLLAIETARASVLGVIAALQTPGPAQTKAIAAIAAGTLGTFALVAGVGKMIDDLTKRIGDTLGKGLQMPNIPTPPPGATPEISSLRTGGTPKKTAEMSERMFQLQLKLNSAEQEGNTIAAAYLKYQIAQVKFEETKVRTRDDALELVKAETALTKELGEAAADVGKQVAADFLKRQELQKNYNQTVQDLQIKAGLITGDKLKQVEIDRELAQILERLPGLTDAQIAKLKDLVTASKDVKDSFDKTFGEGLQQYYKSLADFGGQVAASVKGAFQGLEDQLTTFVITGKANFTDLANSIIADMTRIAIRQAIIKPLVGGVLDIFGIPKSAMGNVFAQNGIQKFARGGIVDRPTLFPFAKGIGLMGEAGPEAIMPLKRGRDGKLGVAGGGGVNVGEINIIVQNTGENLNPLAQKQVAIQVQNLVLATLANEKRSGGILR
jgi:lambda family phage tail tape measure protein